MSSIFKYFIGLSALFIAGCAAYFSVKGLGLLFVGSAVSVMVMAASLELGKLVAASFLYRYWSQINVAMRLYLMGAVLVLIGITSLGIYGYLARAYEQTHAKVQLYESQRLTLEAEIGDIQQQISAARGRLSRLDDVGRSDIEEKHQQIGRIKASLESSLGRLEQRRGAARTKRDKDIEFLKQRLANAGAVFQTGMSSEDKAIADLNQQIETLDRAVDAYTSKGAGFLKQDSIKRGQKLRQEQKPERDATAAKTAAHHKTIRQIRSDHAGTVAAVNASIESIRKDYERRIASFDGEEKLLRTSHDDRSAKLDDQLLVLRSETQIQSHHRDDRIQALYQRLNAGNDQISRINELIAETDIGTYRFVARAFEAAPDDVVKWLILMLVLVFDPLAVALTIGFNVALFGRAGASGGFEGSISGEPVTAHAGGAWRRPSVTAATTLVLVLAGLLGMGGYFGYGVYRETRFGKHANLIPPESFAVLTIRPQKLEQQPNPGSLAAILNEFAPPLLEAKLVDLMASGFEPDTDIYLFVKYPGDQRSDPARRPVLLLGAIAAVADPDEAEAGLSRFAQTLAGRLVPVQLGDAGLDRSRAMVQYGRGRYLEPAGGFFTFAIADGAAVMLMELEGDPQRSLIENEIRLCLANRKATATAAKQNLPKRAIASNGALTLWFDARNCFAQMPKSLAAQTRFEQLQGYLDFDLLLKAFPTGPGKVNVVGHYTYNSDRFKHERPVHVLDALARLGPADDAGVQGRLMDRCADTLDYESLVERLRRGLASMKSDSSGAQVVVEKSINSPRDASFVLEATFAADIGSPIAAALSRIRPQ